VDSIIFVIAYCVFVINWKGFNKNNRFGVPKQIAANEDGLRKNISLNQIFVDNETRKGFVLALENIKCMGLV